MLSFVIRHAFGLLCLYGILWSVALRLTHTERPSGIPVVIYVFGFVGLFTAMGHAGAVAVAGSAGYLAGFAFLFHVALICVALAFNAVPIIHVLGFVTSLAGRELTGLNQIVFPKAYDRATGAESRGDFEAAALLYREEIEADPEDTEARRRLAEILVRAGKPQEGTAELRALLQVVHDREQTGRLLFRLAEITDEHLHDRRQAVQLYERVIREHPKSKLAGYARMRLHGKETTDAPR
jgi:tetratricopeptide (TPR) repeat protein